MKQLSISILLIYSILFSINVSAQDNKPSQTISGTVIDYASGSPLSYVTVTFSDLPGTGAITDNEGKFIINNIPVGRHNLQATFRHSHISEYYVFYAGNTTFYRRSISYFII